MMVSTAIVANSWKSFLDNKTNSTAQTIGPTISWENLLTLGKESNGDCLEVRERNLQVNKACILVFTSGTTGPPKGKGSI